MSAGIDPSSRRIRPLPRIPVDQSSITQASVFTQENTPLNPPSHNRSRESLLTVASTNTIQTILPAYSSTCDLTIVDHGTKFSPGQIDGPSGPIPDPPRYFYILPPSPQTPTSPGSATVPRAFTSDSGNGGSPGAQNSSQQRLGFIEHRLHLKKSPEKTWATLKLVSRTPLPNMTSKAPRFIGGDLVKGVLELNLDRPTNVQSLTLNVKGRMLATRYVKGPTPQNQDCVILDYPHVLYSKKTSGDVGKFGECTTSRNRMPDGKMHGVYRFQFSFPFPTEAVVGSGQNRIPTVTYELPPSFLEKESGVAIKYDLGLTVRYGMLKMDNKVNTNIVYMPKVVAPPVSAVRGVAYEEGTLLPGPRNDPDGWHATPSVTLSGRYRDREAKITCSLWLAKPLCYTRGTVLPCYFALSGSDFEVLEHLSSPKSVHVQLSRYIYFCGDGEYTPHHGSAREEEVGDAGAAVWWKPPKSDQPEDLNARWLEGEIHLSRNLQPSCNHPWFIIQYSVEMMTFPSASFVVHNQEDPRHPIVRQPVEIATFHQYGPVPRAFTEKGEKEWSIQRRPKTGEDKGALMKAFCGPLKEGVQYN